MAVSSDPGAAFFAYLAHMVQEGALRDLLTPHSGPGPRARTSR
ncbi:hypothetical protein [Actinomadura chokoriensis]|uniref:Uncharacterized protein n=1 Tax=Actinomadura chokoriensis TaxID=454156 RepID=A0ABV4QY74_9ACTN